MAGDDCEHELRKKIKRLAGGDDDWLLSVATALDNMSQTVKMLFLEASDDDEARRLAQKLMERAGAFGRDTAGWLLELNAVVRRGEQRLRRRSGFV